MVLNPVISVLYPGSCRTAAPSAADWFVESNNFESGRHAAQSGPLGAGSSCTLSVTVNVPAGELSFGRSVSSAAGNGVLTFEINGVPASTWTGDVPWRQSFYGISAGQYTFSWVYSRGSGVSAGSDAAWLDDVQFSPGKTLTVTGGIGNDYFAFIADSFSNKVIFNGEIRSFSPGQFTNFVLQGGNGSDTAVLVTSGSSANDVTLSANGKAQLVDQAGGYTVTVGGMVWMHAEGHAADTARFYDSPGDDTFYASANYGNSGRNSAGMYGSYGGGYFNSASGFGINLAYSTKGGSDTSIFYDSPGNDEFYAYADYWYDTARQNWPACAAAMAAATAIRPRTLPPTLGILSTAGPMRRRYTARRKAIRSLPSPIITANHWQAWREGIAAATRIRPSASPSTRAMRWPAAWGWPYSTTRPITILSSLAPSYNTSGLASAGMYGTFGGGYSNSAIGFGTNVAYSSNGGGDNAAYYGAKGIDAYYSLLRQDGVQQDGMYGGGYSNAAVGFANCFPVWESVANSAAGTSDTRVKTALATDLALTQLYG